MFPPYAADPIVLVSVIISLVIIVLGQCCFLASRRSQPRLSLRDIISTRTLIPATDNTRRDISALTKVHERDLARFDPPEWTFRRDEQGDFFDHLEAVLEANLPLDRQVGRDHIALYAPELIVRPGRHREAGGGVEIKYETMVDLKVQVNLNEPAERLISDHADRRFRGNFTAPGSNGNSGVSDFRFVYLEALEGADPGAVEHTWSVESKVRGALKRCPLVMWQASTGRGYRLKTVGRTSTRLEGFAPGRPNLDDNDQVRDLETRIRLLSQQLVNEFQKEPVNAIVVHDLHEFILCRCSRPGEIILSQPINNTGLLPEAVIVGGQRRRLVDKPFGLWLAMILDRGLRVRQQLQVAATAEAAAQVAGQPVRRGVNYGHGQPAPPARREMRSMARAHGLQDQPVAEQQAFVALPLTARSLRSLAAPRFTNASAGVKVVRLVGQLTDIVAGLWSAIAVRPAPLHALPDKSMHIRVPSGTTSESAALTSTSVASSGESSSAFEAEPGQWPDHPPVNPPTNTLLVPPPSVTRAAPFPFMSFVMRLVVQNPSIDTPYLPPASPSPDESEDRLCLGAYIASGRMWDVWSGILYFSNSDDGRSRPSPLPVVIKIASADPAYERPAASLPRTDWEEIDRNSWSEAELYCTCLAPLQGAVVPRWLGLYDGQGVLRSLCVSRETGSQLPAWQVRCGFRVMVMENVGAEMNLQEIRDHRPQILSAYQALHARGVIHGDVAIRHIRLCGDRERDRNQGRVVLLDFGEASRASEGDGHDAIAEEDDEVRDLLVLVGRNK